MGEQEFKLLKQIELDTIKYVELKEEFSYEQWRKRVPGEDKLVDSALIKHYLEEFRHKVKVTQEDFYLEVQGLYDSLVNASNGSIVE